MVLMGKGTAGACCVVRERGKRGAASGKRQAGGTEQGAENGVTHCLKSYFENFEMA